MCGGGEGSLIQDDYPVSDVAINEMCPAEIVPNTGTRPYITSISYNIDKFTRVKDNSNIKIKDHLITQYN